MGVNWKSSHGSKLIGRFQMHYYMNFLNVSYSARLPILKATRPNAINIQIVVGFYLYCRFLFAFEQVIVFHFVTILVLICRPLVSQKLRWLSITLNVGICIINEVNKMINCVT